MRSVVIITHLIADSSAQGGDKENYSVGEDNSNKDAVIKMELMQSQLKMTTQINSSYPT